MIVPILFLAVILVDVYIYRSVISARFRHLPARVGYIVFAVLTDVGVLSMFLLYGLQGDNSSAGMGVIMWLLWVFLLTAFPKLLFALGSMLDWLVSLVVRRKYHLFRWVGGALSVVVVVGMICGASVGRKQIVVRSVEVCSPRLPEGFEGYRIVQFSDVHLGTLNRPKQRLAQMVEVINSLDADLVVNSGDIVNISYRDFSPEAVAELAQIRARDGVVSVLGNHDLGFYVRDSLALPPAENVARLGEIFSEMGWHTLRDQTMYVHRGGDSIAVSGLNYPADHHLNGHNADLASVDLAKTFEGVPPEIFSVVVSHAPQMWDDITLAGRGDLTLSGHTHAMQLKINLLGWQWSPAQLLYKEWSGLYRNGENKALYINDGIGYVGYPMRVGAPSEITLITLRKCE
ncbi:MAG: metallophosphoesterase [Rikenellaceae bacterium]|jgi:predicted MPP superfamily phosphohydrolase|nr:metallophosphoesterase [Rikenellaceae bacterium]